MKKFNEFSQLEGLERTSYMIEFLTNRLGDSYFDEYLKEIISENLHPAIYDKKAEELLAKATEALVDLYQHIGAWGIDNDSET